MSDQDLLCSPGLTSPLFLAFFREVSYANATNANHSNVDDTLNGYNNDDQLALALKLSKLEFTRDVPPQATPHAGGIKKPFLYYFHRALTHSRHSLQSITNSNHTSSASYTFQEESVPTSHSQRRATTTNLTAVHARHAQIASLVITAPIRRATQTRDRRVVQVIEAIARPTTATAGGAIPAAPAILTTRRSDVHRK